MIKMMAGRLHEGKVLFNKAFSAKRLWHKYKDDLDPNAVACFEKINRYFGRANVIEKIRNKFAFHFDVASVATMYERLPPEATFVDYLASQYAEHNLFFGAEVLTLNAMIEMTGEPD
jgi:hypothetical protein